MNPAPATKGSATRERLLERAIELARADGLDGLTIGSLAIAAQMSKSGVFAHFGSREDLQVAVLDQAAADFVQHVFRPSLGERRGLPRYRAIFQRWQEHMRRLGRDGGCVLIAAATEFDDKPGAVRERLIDHERGLRREMTRCLQMAIDAGDLRTDADPAQIAFETYSLVLGTHHDLRVFDSPEVFDRALRAFDALLARHTS